MKANTDFVLTPIVNYIIKDKKLEPVSSFYKNSLRWEFSDIYFHRYSLREDQQSWSVCRAKQVQLMIKISLSSQSAKQTGNNPPIALLTLDSVDTSTRQSFGVNWKPCEVKKPGKGKNKIKDSI